MTASKKVATEQYVCDICKAEGVDANFKAPTALGMHKRIKHGILGSSTAAKQYRHAKEQKQLVEPQAHVKVRRNSQKRSIEDDGKALITVGKLTAYCEAEAEKLGVSKEPFTRRCAELFLASQIGT